MATYTIVDKDTDPLGPNEIAAGTTIQVEDGDVFIIDASANEVVTFESASGSSTDFDIQIDDSNANAFSIQIMEDLNPDIAIGNDVDIEDIDIKAEKAESMILTGGDNVLIGEIHGSETGADVILFGDDFTTYKDISTKDGGASITLGDGALVKGIYAEGGNDTITLGANLQADYLKTGVGGDSVWIGNGGDIDELDTGTGNDTVAVGNNFTADNLETKDGDDLVITGTGADIHNLDGGNGFDVLVSGTLFVGGKNFESLVICFVRGTRILTDRGETPIEDLRAGDLVQTMDHGAQPIRWIGSSRMVGHGKLAPVRIRRGALGNAADLWVSQQHRMVINAWQADLLFGEPEVLVAAKHLVDGRNIDIVAMDRVDYYHILFDRHEIIFAEGCASESYHPGEVGLDTLSLGAREEIYTLFPGLRENPMQFGSAARASLRSFEGRLLAA